MLNDITWVEKEFSPIIKNTLSLYAIESVSDKFLMSSDTALIRATKRGVLWTLAENLESEVLTQNSHLRERHENSTAMRVYRGDHGIFQ